MQTEGRQVEESVLIKEWLDLSERDFHALLKQKIKETGEIGDVFPAMVGHNVPHYILQRLWPEKWESYHKDPAWVAFGAAEDGWKGRIDNINSRLTPLSSGSASGTASGENRAQANLELSKSYVLDSEFLLGLCRLEDEFALCWIRSDKSGQTDSGQIWSSRDDVAVQFTRTLDGRKFDHCRLQAKGILEGADYLPVQRRAYAALGMQIPRRELTSLAILSSGLLAHLGLLKDFDTEFLDEREELILAARDKEKLSRREPVAAAEMLDVFYKRVQEAGAKVHPFWEKVSEMRNFLAGAKK